MDVNLETRPEMALAGFGAQHSTADCVVRSDATSPAPNIEQRSQLNSQADAAFPDVVLGQRLS